MTRHKSFACSVIGGSHIKHGVVCQDASEGFDREGLSLAIVADGHGDANCFRSDKGAKIAVDCARRGVCEFADFAEGLFQQSEPPTREQFATLLRHLVKGIVADWQNVVESDYTANPFMPEELAGAGEKYRKRYEQGKERYKAYGATLMAVAVTDLYWFGFHIGDGRFTALYADGSFGQPVPWDERCYLNVTTSICDYLGEERPRIHFAFASEEPPPAAVYLCSDGVDDNYPVQDNELHLYEVYRTVTRTFDKDGFDSTCEQLKELANKYAIEGKGDDTSIAGVIDMDAVKAVVGLWPPDAESEAAPAEPGGEEDGETEEAAAPVEADGPAAAPDDEPTAAPTAPDAPDPAHDDAAQADPPLPLGESASEEEEKPEAAAGGEEDGHGQA